MILTIVLSVAATAGAYEYLSSLVPTVPVWLIFPLLVALSVGVYYLSFMWLLIVAVASVAGFFHGFMNRRSSPPMIIQNRRSGLPPLP